MCDRENSLGFGERIRREREMRNITLDEIVNATKIGSRTLRALEDEDFSKLPGGIFNKGFVRAYARYLGIDEEQAVADYLAAHPAKRLMIVTEGPHSRRARWIFQRTLAGRPVEIEMLSAPTDEFDSEDWWRCEEGFLFVVSEYFKLFYYGLRYGRLGYEIAGGVAVIILLRAWFSHRRKLNRMVTRPQEPQRGTSKPGHWWAVGRDPAYRVPRPGWRRPTNPPRPCPTRQVFPQQKLNRTATRPQGGTSDKSGLGRDIMNK